MRQNIFLIVGKSITSQSYKVFILENIGIQSNRLILGVTTLFVVKVYGNGRKANFHKNSGKLTILCPRLGAE